MTTVKTSLGMTLNLGNFQSLRVEVGIEDDVRTTETAEEAFERIYQFVETQLAEKVTEARGTLSGNKS